MTENDLVQGLPKAVSCQVCGKVRTDEPDYGPLLLMQGVMGWYSGEDDGEICPSCMTAMFKKGNSL